MAEQPAVEPTETEARNPGPGAYAALLAAIVFFSGLAEQWDTFAVFSFRQLLGTFGSVGDGGATFLGTGGSAVRQGFLFALSLIPGVMLALGIVSVAEHCGAMRAAQRVLTPLLRPLLGLPGVAGLALLLSMQSSDAGGAMTRELYESGRITDTERSIFAAFQFSAGATVTVYLAGASAFFHALEVSYLLPLCIIFFYKMVGANVVRLYLNLRRPRRASGNTGQGQSGGSKAWPPE